MIGTLSPTYATSYWGPQVTAAFASAAAPYIQTAGFSPWVPTASPYAAAPTMWAPNPWAAFAVDPGLLQAVIEQHRAQQAAAAQQAAVAQQAAAAQQAAVAQPSAAATAPSSNGVAAAALPYTAAVRARGAAAAPVSVARRALDARSAHVSQVASRFNPNAPAANRDCGPASVVMTLRMLGLNVPGGSSTAANTQRQVDAVRAMMFGSSNVRALRDRTTTNKQIEQVLEAAGASVETVNDGATIAAAVRAGKPVILNGNPGAAGAYGKRFSPAQMTRYNGAHWIVVSAYDAKTNSYVINDPLSKVGPVRVSARELEAYRGGSLGLIVEKAAAQAA